MSGQGDADGPGQALRNEYADISTIGEGKTEFSSQDDSGDPFHVLDRQRIAQAIAIAQLIGSCLPPLLPIARRARSVLACRHRRNRRVATE